MTTTLPPNLIAILDRVADPNDIDLAEIKTQLDMAESWLVGKWDLEKPNRDQRLDIEMAYDSLADARDLLLVVARRLGYDIGP